MTSGLTKIVFPVKDLGRAKELFSTLLGVEPTMDQPYYVGFDLEGQHVGLDPNGHRQGMTGPIPYREVDDINDSLKRLLDARAQLRREVSDVGGGTLIATVADPDGNVVGLVQPARPDQA